jgi:hypothetical protein
MAKKRPKQPTVQTKPAHPYAFLPNGDPLGFLATFAHERVRRILDEAGAARDMVNAPPHYRAHPSGVECITVTEHMSFNVGNAVKYLWRAGLKSPSAVEDLKKAAWYVNREIERLGK